MAYQKTKTPKNKRRGEMSKLDLAEAYYRGGYEQGFGAALEAVKKVLTVADAHVQELEKWAESDPAIERDPPGLALETAA